MKTSGKHAPNVALAHLTLSLIFLICVSKAVLAQSAAGQSTPVQSESQWATDKAFQQARRRPFSISWQAAPLRSRTNELAQQQRISILLDRRLDPRTPINLSASNVTMEQLLLQICDQENLGFCRLGDSFYLGPKQAADRLLASSQNTSKPSRKTHNTLLKKAASAWPDLTTPKEALETILAQTDLKLENADLLPHDLMPSASTPTMTLDQRLQLLLVQFDLGYELKRNSKTLVLRRIADLPTSGTVRFSDVDLTLAQYQKIKGKAANSRLRRNKKSVTVTGPVDELVTVRDFIVKSFTPPAPTVSEQQFTLTVTNRRSAILAAIGKQLQMPVDTSLADPAAMREVVSLSVDNVSLQELLDQIMAGAGATCVVADGKIIAKN